MLRRCLIALAFAVVVPAASAATASAAATVTTDGVTVTFTDSPGQDGSVEVGHAHDDALDVAFLDADATTEHPSCSDYIYDPPPGFFGDPPPRKIGVRCQGDGDERVVVTMGDGQDRVTGRPPSRLCGTFLSTRPCVDPISRPFQADGGAGRDALTGGVAGGDLRGGDGDDTLTGGAEADKLDGGGGRDTLTGNLGADELHGGGGIDEVRYTYTDERVLASLDDQPDDGVAGEADNAHSDIEDITTGAGDDVLTGSARSNTLSSGAGVDQLEGLGGFDAYYATEGADTIRARDGSPDRVDCGEDSDIATVDTGDRLSGCETTDVSDALEGDLDRDGFREPADCQDTDPSIHPNASDAPDNGVDENCDGRDTTIRDRDGDGFLPPADCDDASAAARPGAVEIFGNSVDENCNGRADPLQSISSFVRTSFRAGRRVTRVRRLRAAAVRGGTVVKVTCRVKRRKRFCKRRRRSFEIKRDVREFDLRKPLRLRKVRPGVRLRVEFLRPDSLSKRYTFRFRRKKLPRTTIQCRRPETGKYGRCP